MKKLFTNKKTKWFVGILAIVITSVTFSFTEDLFELSKSVDILSSAYRELAINYVDEVNASKLMKKGMDAMLDELDPYTEFVPEDEIEDYKIKYVNTQYGGIGASVFTRDGRIIISEVYEGFPAQLNDLRPGDEILKINDIDIKIRKNDDISLLLKGAKGSSVKVVVKRLNQVIEKKITRDEIKQPNVSYFGLLKNNIGYIKLDKFLENSAQEVKIALDSLRKQNAQKIILDLRFNGGGLLGEAVKIVNLFTPKGTEVVSQKGKNLEFPTVYRTTQDPTAPDMPLVVLINKNSASASEIVAGSLQDLDRAVIIGQRSFGKGLVQQTFSLPYNSLIKITVAKYYVSSGRCIQALDYSHKNANGTVTRRADSLLLEFKTRNGRLVYDGNGIYPDIVSENIKKAPILDYLAEGFLLFDYATKYREEHTSILPADNYKISDITFTDFVTFVNNKSSSLKNKNKADKLLLDLKTELDKNKKEINFDLEYAQLAKKIASIRRNELFNSKNDISHLLSTEISSRYYYQKGRTLCNFQFDNDIKEANKVFSTPNLYSAILNGEGRYKVIGKPESKAYASATKLEDE